MMGSAVKPRLAAALALVFAVLATACAHVGREDFEAEIAELRAELEGQDSGMDSRNAAQIAALSARLDRLTDALSDLEGEFDVTVERLETAIRFDVPVYFAFDRDELRPEDLPVLARFGDVVSEYYPEVLLTVEGFTDRAGSPEYNLRSGEAARRNRPPLPGRNRWIPGGSCESRQLRRRSRAPRLPRSGGTR